MWSTCPWPRNLDILQKAQFQGILNDFGISISVFITNHARQRKGVMRLRLKRNIVGAEKRACSKLTKEIPVIIHWYKYSLNTHTGGESLMDLLVMRSCYSSRNIEDRSSNSRGGLKDIWFLCCLTLTPDWQNNCSFLGQWPHNKRFVNQILPGIHGTDALGDDEAAIPNFHIIS